LLAERSNGTFSIPVHDILDNGADTVVVLATHSAQRDDRGLAMPAVHLWRVTDGKVTSHESFVSDVFAQDEFWS
jgi:ketosteroid isomerase-like protein